MMARSLTSATILALISIFLYGCNTARPSDADVDKDGLISEYDNFLRGRSTRRITDLYICTETKPSNGFWVKFCTPQSEVWLDCCGNWPKINVRTTIQNISIKVDENCNPPHLRVYFMGYVNKQKPKNKDFERLYKEWVYGPYYWDYDIEVYTGRVTILVSSQDLKKELENLLKNYNEKQALKIRQMLPGSFYYKPIKK